MNKGDIVNRHSVEIFCSYAHRDKALRDELANHLRRAHVSTWHDREIKAGTDWADEIDEHLERADIVLLLVSSDFMASSYCYEKEMMRALERHEKEGIFVIPLIMRPVYWGDAPFKSLQVSPSSLKAVTSWANRDEAFVEIATDVRRAIDHVLKKQYIQDAEQAIADDKYQNAYGSYLQALNYDLEDGTLCQEIGDLLVKLERNREALDMYEKAILLEPENDRLYRKKGDVLALLMRHEEALEAYEKAIELKKSDFALYKAMGNTLYILRRLDEALEAYEKALYLQPDNYQLYMQKRNVLFDLAHYQEALEAYDKRVKICPGCFQHNRPDSLRCKECQRSLVGVVSQTSVQTSQLGMSSPTIMPEPDIPSPLPDTPSFQPTSPDYLAGKPDERRQQGQRHILFSIPIGVFVGVFVITIIVSSFRVFSPAHPQKNSSFHTDVLSQLGEFKASNGQLLGVNDGSSAPFLLGSDGQLKQQAFAQLKQGHASQAISLWRAALHITNNDAEAWIYLENQSVLLSGLSYITLVVGTDLFDSSGSGLNVLQGVYVAQREFNTGNHGFRIRILIANSGTDTNNVSVITQKIVNIAKKDKTVVGVISWLSSTENIIALPNLSNAHIPMIAPDAASDQLTNASPYFLRIIAPDKVQGKQNALFVEHTLHARKVVIFVDNSDSYSQNATQNFEDQFTKDGNTILKVEPFTTDKTSKIKNLIQDALGMNPDLLFFTSSDGSDDANFEDALPTSGPFAKLPVLTGGAGNVIHKAVYGRWYFNPDAFPDEWVSIEGNSSPQPPFFQDYSNDFNEDGLRLPGVDGYTRPNSDTILSYDVASVFLNAIQMVITSNKIRLTIDGLQHITPELLAQTLPHIALQGVSGWIAFDPKGTGNPINKAFVFLAVASDGRIYMKDWQGCFTQTLCRNAN